MAVDRSNLRLSDLSRRTHTGTRLMNVKLPVDTLNAIERLTKELKATKTSVVVALLNEGLSLVPKARKR